MPSVPGLLCLLAVAALSGLREKIPVDSRVSTLDAGAHQASGRDET